MTPLPDLMVAPNGARRTKADHPNLPITLPEILDTARTCQAAGAGGLHLHLRTADGIHVLDSGLYREAVAELSHQLPELIVQITTESAGLYAPSHQRHIALNSGANLISVSIREILSRGETQKATKLFADCAECGIAVQHILYDLADLALLKSTLPEKAFTSPNLQLLFVLGRYSQNQQSTPRALDPFLDALKAQALTPDWAACAFGSQETACLVKAHDLGGKMRVGFENSLHHPDGTLATDNAARVAQLRQSLCASAPCHSPSET